MRRRAAAAAAPARGGRCATRGAGPGNPPTPGRPQQWQTQNAPAPRLRLKGVAALLQLPAPFAKDLAAREPGLLMFRTPELRGRLDHLAEQLQVRRRVGRVGAGAGVVVGPQAERPRGRPFVALQARPRVAKGHAHWGPLLRARVRWKQVGNLHVCRCYCPTDLARRRPPPLSNPQVPPQRAAALAARTPALLTQLPRAVVEQRLTALAALLGLPSADAAAAAAARAPAVLLEPLGLIEAQIANLGRILGLRPAEAAAVAAAQPGLLLLPPQVMRSRLEALAVALKADVEDARTAAVKRPALLAAPPAALRKAAQEAGVP